MITITDVRDVLLPLAARSDRDAVRVYQAMTNVLWVPIDSDHQQYTQENVHEAECLAWGFREAGGLIAEWRGLGENYMTFYCSGLEGTVHEEVAVAMRGIGYRPVWA